MQSGAVTRIARRTAHMTSIETQARSHGHRHTTVIDLLKRADQGTVGPSQTGRFVVGRILARRHLHVCFGHADPDSRVPLHSRLLQIVLVETYPRVSSRCWYKSAGWNKRAYLLT